MDRRHFLTDVVGVSIAQLVASDLIEHGFAAALHGGDPEQAIALDERPSLGRLNAVMGKAHVAAIRGDVNTAMGLLGEGRRVFDAAGSDDTESDYAVPWWRFQRVHLV